MRRNIIAVSAQWHSPGFSPCLLGGLASTAMMPSPDMVGLTALYHRSMTESVVTVRVQFENSPITNLSKDRVTSMEKFSVNISLLLAACAPLLALSACVDTRPYIIPPGVTNQQFDKDFAACRYDVAKAQASNPDTVDTMVSFGGLWDQCMAVKGYSK